MRPASVSVPFFDDRSKSCSPSSTSRRRTAWLTAGCVRCTLAAAREKLRSCATARKIFRAPRSTAGAAYNKSLFFVNHYHFDFSPPEAYNCGMTNPARVVVFDTTLRDGEQAPGFSMDVPSKVAMAEALDRLGVDIIEAGFPIASPADAEAVRQIALGVRRPVIAALARTTSKDIEEAARALEPAARSRIHTFLATSDLRLSAKLRMTREECLASAVSAVTLARTFTD